MSQNEGNGMTKKINLGKTKKSKKSKKSRIKKI
jgi:hypothetical protein